MVLCQTPQEAYIVTYPEAVAFAEIQASIAWPPTEYPVEDDIQEFLTIATPAEKHAVTTTLKLFTKYELIAGNEYWSGRISRRYPRVCIQRMANAFANAELCMHAPFYNELNKALNLDTEEFYTDYVNDPVLLARMEFINKCISGDDDLLSVAVFSMVEGAILYAAFSFLKSYQVGGKNLFRNLISGINSSVRDENLHAEGGAWLYKQHLSEENLSKADRTILRDKIYLAADQILEHETQIIAMLFTEGQIPGITETQMVHFVESRLNICLKNLGIKPRYTVTYNPVADWFYDNINAIKFHDFFQISGNEYRRDWSMGKFTW